MFTVTISSVPSLSKSATASPREECLSVTPGTGRVAHVVEPATAVVIPVDESALVKRLPHAGLVYGWVDMPVGDEDVLESVMVYIQECGAPAQVLGIDCEAGRDRLVDEHLHALVQIQGVRVVGEIRLEDIQVSVKVEVSRRGSHAGLLLPIHVVGGAGDDAHLFKRAVSVVVEEQAGCRVACNVDIRPSRRC